MNKYKLLSFTVLSAGVWGCKPDKETLNSYFSIDTSTLKQVYTRQESIELNVKNDKNKAVDSVIYSLNDKKIAAAKKNNTVKISLEQQKLGFQKLSAVIYTQDGIAETEINFTIASGIEPKLLKYKIVNTYPHDIKAYTQGFEFYRDTLFEGTGNGAGNGTGIKDISSLRKTNYKTGQVLKKIVLEPQYFGEGITILNNKVYQLTWQHNEGYVYDADTFKKLKTFTYFKKMQGWGLANDGKAIYMSEGSEKIYKLDPETLSEIDHINVYTQNAKIEALNELEWVEGKIWANIYTKDAIAVINPQTGEVESVINLSDLKAKVTQHPDLDYLNGIAYNPKTKTVFITGKNWDKAFEIVVE